MTHILLVDDHKTFLAGTRMILEKHQFSVTTAASGAEALLLLQGAPFDLCVFDLKLPEMNGFELTRRTLLEYPDMPVVILTGEELEEHYDRLIELGVCGLVDKAVSEQELALSLRLALQRKVVLPLHLARQLRTKTARLAAPDNPEQDRAKALSEKEIGILKLVAQGLKNKEIADKLFMSQRNVEYILSHLFEKLQAASRQEALLKAIELGLLRIDT